MNIFDNTNKNFILSLCVPTYNQPDAVRRTLKSIIPQATDEVEILIRDDSTNNLTEQIIKSFSDFKNLRYFRGVKEGVGGIDKALIFLTQEARGDFVWWLGDDVLVEGAIERVIKLIKDSPEISFIWVNSCDINNKNDVAFELRGDKFFDNRNQVLEENIGMLGFISSTIFKREKSLSGIENSKKYIGSAFVSLYLILHVLSQNGKYYFLSNPYILAEPKLAGGPRWYDAFQVFGINLYKIVYEFKDKFDNRSIKKALSDNFRKTWRAVLVERALGFTTGFGSKTPKIKQMFQYYWNYPEFWIALPLFLMPRFILRIFYKFFRNIKKINK